MKFLLPVLLSLAACLPAVAHDDEKPMKCPNCAAWNKEIAPFKVYGNSYYVGPAELGAMLVTGAQGHILLDGALPQSAALIRKNIETLGFRIEDVKLIVNSHPHWDHLGGIAALQRMSGAVVAASPSSAKVLREGTIGPDDPQFERKHVARVAKVAEVREIADGEVLRVGELALTAHFTPGHTPGGTTWSWESCEQGACRSIVYADSLNPVSNGDFRFLGDAKRPDITPSFRASIDRIAQMKCDIVLANHPGFVDMDEKLAARTAEKNTLIDPEGCRKYAAGALRRLEVRLAKERSPDWERIR